MVRPSEAPRSDSKSHGSAAKKPEEKKVRKKHRFKPGTVAVREIRRAQGKSSTGQAIPFEPLKRVIKEVSQQENPNLRWKRSALLALQEATQHFLTDVLDLTNMATLHRGREAICPHDMKFISQIVKKIAPASALAQA